MSAGTADSVGIGRRHDVDLLRTCALGLLIVYHCAISFQPFGILIGFIQNKELLPWLWPAMSLINIWRIPILFMVSGMGVRFAMERRDWKALLKDRTVRILVPFVFGYFAICPIFVFLLMRHYGNEPTYVPNPGHLWFLGNIFAYVLLLLPLLVYLRRHPENIVHRTLTRVFAWPAGLFVVALLPIAETLLVNPATFPTFALTPHGFWLGLVCFLTGFVLVSLGDVFWKAAEKTRFIALGIAIALYLVRWLAYGLKGEPKVMVAFESTCWMLALFGFGSRHLNKPSKALSFLSKAVYPVYIVHMPVQYGISFFLLPLEIPAAVKLVILIVGTLGVSLLIYEVLRRLKWIAPLFGITVKCQTLKPPPVSSPVIRAPTPQP